MGLNNGVKKKTQSNEGGLDVGDSNVFRKEGDLMIEEAQQTTQHNQQTLF
jgi:hypothetical protein